MAQKKKVPKLTKNKYGFWQYKPAPSEAVLAKYYAGKYYQQGLGSYAVAYTPEEIEYFRLKPLLMLLQLKRLQGLRRGMTFLDVGCGEGWALDRFFREGFKVTGVDFSDYGVKKFNPGVRKFLHQGNAYELLKDFRKQRRTWDVILLANVLEHVINPEELIRTLRKLLRPQGKLIVIAPNDFSSLHTVLLKKKYIDRSFWLAYPDHLSYFNKEGMCSFLKAFKMKVDAVVADNPVDLNLLNDNSNYIRDKSKGKKAHLFRVRTDNFLGSISKEKLLDLYTLYGQMGVGRDLNYFCSRI